MLRTNKVIFVAGFMVSLWACGSSDSLMGPMSGSEYCGISEVDVLLKKLDVDGFHVGYEVGDSSFSAKRVVARNGVISSTLVLSISLEGNRVVSCNYRILHTGP